MDGSIEILCNGEKRQTLSRTVFHLLEELELTGKRVAVELNRSIVPRADFQNTPIRPGDAIEIVHFVGGG